MSMLSPLLNRVAERPDVPLGIVGEAGIGKTQMVEEWAEAHNLPLVKLLSSTLDETDVAGIVVREGNHATTLTPDWAERLGERGVLFCDELNCARKEVLDTLLTLFCSREFPNGDKLPENTIIIAAMNPSGSYDNTDLNPAMKTRFMWTKHSMPVSRWMSWLLGKGEADSFAHQPLRPVLKFKDWLKQFQSDPDFEADKKALLTEARKLGFKFATEDEYLSEELPTTPRGMCNLLYWTRSAYEAVQWAPAFISDAQATILRSVDMTAYKNVSNAVFQNNGRAQVSVNGAEDAHLQNQQSIVDRIKAVASGNSGNSSTPEANDSNKIPFVVTGVPVK